MKTPTVPVDHIDALPGQPRRLFAGLEELAESIRTHGILCLLYTSDAADE